MLKNSIDKFLIYWQVVAEVKVVNDRWELQLKLIAFEILLHLGEVIAFSLCDSVETIFSSNFLTEPCVFAVEVHDVVGERLGAVQQVAEVYFWVGLHELIDVSMLFVPLFQREVSFVVKNSACQV